MALGNIHGKIHGNEKNKINNEKKNSELKVPKVKKKKKPRRFGLCPSSVEICPLSVEICPLLGEHHYL